eukprot:TRINITY_DN47774_c0_g1_i1.p1 TRINITY_DN47774_c0_g1~~TRINITY_DN47774_c0_g1_i1.p1  ORF type:complete len:291 (-),score=33.56 TRINITY_DN47774_c0_g1_i1:2-874(-)
MNWVWWGTAACVAALAAYSGKFLLSKQFPVLDPLRSAVLITGASSGIGRDCALTLCKQYTVFATVRKKSDADSLVEAAKATQGSLIPVILDVAKPEEIRAAVKVVEAHVQERSLLLAALINNAGVNLESRSLDDPAAEWPASSDVIRGTLEVNVVGLLEATRVFLPLLKQAKGRIINIGSYFGSFTPLKLQQLGYSASKHAVEAISDGLRRGLAPEDVAVTLLKPGNIVTSMNPGHGEDKATIISDAIISALSSPTPPSRMFVGQVKGAPMWLICRLFAHGPDWLGDLLL